MTNDPNILNDRYWDIILKNATYWYVNVDYLSPRLIFNVICEKYVTTMLGKFAENTFNFSH